MLQCCSPQLPGTIAWGILNAIFGWTNSATYGSVISYNVYWIFVMAGFIVLRFRESTGRWPLMKAKAHKTESPSESLTEQRSSGSDSNQGGVLETKGDTKEKTTQVAQ